MKRSDPKTDQATLAAFVEMDDEQALPVVDRSTLENYASCPAKARYIETGKVNNSSLIASTGDEVHSALSRTLDDYVQSRGALNASEIVNDAQSNLLNSRPDVQPDVIRAGKYATWGWGKFITGINPENILRYDGGKGDRSGQLAWDLSDVRITSEIDLLYAGPSKKLLHEIDYKSGWKEHSASTVAESFQFQLHWWLVAHNYPDIEALEVKVWNTRSNKLTRGVEFDRDDLPAIMCRIGNAATEYLTHYTKLPERAPAWPAVEKCSICPAAVCCPQAGAGYTDIAQDPAKFVDNMVATEGKLNAMRKIASEWVDTTGKDIYSRDQSSAFGIGRPRAERRPTKDLYALPKHGA